MIETNSDSKSALPRLIAVTAVFGVAAWYTAHPDWIAKLFGSQIPTVFHAQISFFATALILAVAVPAATYGTDSWKPVLGSLGLGDVKFGTKMLLIGVPIAILSGYVGAGSPAIAEVYPLGRDLSMKPAVFGPYMVGYLAYYIAFEFFFRGMLIFRGPKQDILTGRNNFQAILVTVFHIGKPFMELAGALPASWALGWITIRTGSIWYALVIHWVVGGSLDFFLLIR